MECNGPQCSTLRTNSSQESYSCSDGGCECLMFRPGFASIWWNNGHKAAMAAMFEAKKDRIKSRLKKFFGPTLDKGADAVVETISEKISVAVQNSKTEQELHNKLVSILTEATD